MPQGNIADWNWSISQLNPWGNAMSNIRVGDTVAFRRDVAVRCNSKDVAEYRGIVTGIAGTWLFIEETSGRTKVMPIESMSRVAPNGVILELV